MNVFRVVAVMALLTGPVYAQAPVLIQELNEKTPQQKADEELKAKFSKESPKKMPEADAKTSVDPWGNVRSRDAAKTPAAKTSSSKMTISAKPRPKTGAAAE
jgi:hypothetical protein